MVEATSCSQALESLVNVRARVVPATAAFVRTIPARQDGTREDSPPPNTALLPDDDVSAATVPLPSSKVQSPTSPF